MAYDREQSEEAFEKAVEGLWREVSALLLAVLGQVLQIREELGNQVLKDCSV